jgi:hypothetical protein
MNGERKNAVECCVGNGEENGYFYTDGGIERVRQVK